MKKIIIMVALSLSLFKAQADEGMWLPMLLGQQVYNDMVKKGLKLTKEQLYSINKVVIKRCHHYFWRRLYRRNCKQPGFDIYQSPLWLRCHFRSQHS